MSEEKALTAQEDERLLGIYDDFDFEEYKKAPAMNNSHLKLLHESPATYMDYKHHPKPDTHDTRVGHALHCLVFEPDKFDKLYIPSKFNEFRTNEAKEWRQAAEEMGKTVLKTSKASEDPHRNPSEYDMVCYMSDAIRSHPILKVMLDDCVFERTIFWVDKKPRGEDGEKTFRLCKCRLDGYTPGHSMVLDLKSCQDASYSGFTRAVHNFQYYRQHAWYLDGCMSEEAKLDVSNGFKFIAAEKQPPWHVEMYNLPVEWIAMAHGLIDRDMLHYHLCKQADIWPGYGQRVIRDETTPTGFSVKSEPIRDLAVTPYAKYHHIY